MKKFLRLFFLLFFTSASINICGQTAAQYLEKSNALWSRGQFDQALKYAWLAEPLVADSTGRDSKEYGYFASQYFAMNHEGAGNNDSAIYWNLFGLNMMKAHNDTASVAYGETLSNYGLLLNNLSRYSEAFPYVQQGAAVMSHFPSHVDSYLASIANLATTYNYYGSYTQAKDLYQKCLKESEEHPDEILPAHVNVLIQNLATIYFKTGDVINAEKYFCRAIDSAKASNDMLTYFVAKKTLGTLYLATGKIDTAERILNEIYNDPILKKLVTVNANKLFTTQYLEAVASLGQVRRFRKDFTGSEKFYRQLMTTVDTLKDARVIYSALSGLALLYKEMHQNSKADSVYEYLFKRVPEVDQFSYISTYYEYCENLVIGKQLQKAAEKTRFIIDTLFIDLYKNFPGMDADGQMKYVQTLNRYRNLLPAALAENKKNRNEYITYAHNRLLQLKAMLLTYQQRKLQILRNSSDTALASLNKRWNVVKEMLYTNYSAGKTTTNIDSLEEVAKMYDKLITVKTGVPVESITEDISGKISKKLKNREVAIEFVRYGISQKNGSRYGAFVIRQGKPVAFVQLCSESSLKQCFRNKALKNFNNDYQLTNNRQLYDFVWQPLTPLLKDAYKIYYSPDGLLNNISFDALAPADGQYLITKKRLIQLSNLRNLLNISEKNLEIHSASLWGSIDYMLAYKRNTKTTKKKNKPGILGVPEDVATKAGIGKLNSLANDEVTAIDLMMKQKKLPVTTFKNKKATEGNFNRQASTFKGLLHISSHGYYFTNPTQTSSNQIFSNSFALQQNPLLRSGLILSGGQYKWLERTGLPDPEDGILTGYEIAMMDLSKVKLVVLSACETALGDIDPGSEGVLGLQRAFKLAGVDKMILTLWSVNTVATEAFMKKFYQALLANNDPAAALYNVKKEMAVKKIPPYAWAGFILIE